jgi:hypothetical protein
MASLSKNKAILIGTAVVLIFAGICLVFKDQLRNFFKKAGPAQEFTLSGKILSIDAQNNLLTIKPANQGADIEVLINNSTKLTKLEAPFSDNNPPPPGTQFTPRPTEISISDLKLGDDIFLKSSENIFGKSKIDNIEFLKVLP